MHANSVIVIAIKKEQHTNSVDILFANTLPHFHFAHFFNSGGVPYSLWLPFILLSNGFSFTVFLIWKLKTQLRLLHASKHDTHNKIKWKNTQTSGQNAVIYVEKDQQRSQLKAKGDILFYLSSNTENSDLGLLWQRTETQRLAHTQAHAGESNNNTTTSTHPWAQNIGLHKCVSRTCGCEATSACICLCFVRQHTADASIKCNMSNGSPATPSIRQFQGAVADHLFLWYLVLNRDEWTSIEQRQSYNNNNIAYRLDMKSDGRWVSAACNQTPSSRYPLRIEMNITFLVWLRAIAI